MVVRARRGGYSRYVFGWVLWFAEDHSENSGFENVLVQREAGSRSLDDPWALLDLS